MSEWLYKAREVPDGDPPKPNLEMTQAFAVEDGILCRSAYDISGSWIPNVRAVQVGDIIHFFFKSRGRSPHQLIGSFRVKDPGAARLNAECSLAIVTDPDLERRLRGAYAVGPGEKVTGWLLVAESSLPAPSPDEPAVAKFLKHMPTLAKHAGLSPDSAVVATDRVVSTVSGQLPALPTPLRLIHGPLLVTIETWSDRTVVARFPAARLFGEGPDDTSALESLAERIAEFIEVHLLHAHAGELGGTLAKQWAALTAMIDVSGVRVPMERAREVG